MGTWGTALFDNDYAKDVRGDYIDKLYSGKSAEEASREIVLACRGRDAMGIRQVAA